MVRQSNTRQKKKNEMGDVWMELNFFWAMKLIVTIFLFAKRMIPAVILTWRPLYIKGLAIHKTVSLSRGPLLCYTARTAWPSGLCCAAHIPSPQDKLIQLAVTEEPADSSHSVPVIMPGACPCLYLETQQEFLTWTSSLALEMINRVVFL